MKKYVKKYKNWIILTTILLSIIVALSFLTNECEYQYQFDKKDYMTTEIMKFKQSPPEDSPIYGRWSICKVFYLKPYFIGQLCKKHWKILTKTCNNFISNSPICHCTQCMNCHPNWDYWFENWYGPAPKDYPGKNKKHPMPKAVDIARKYAKKQSPSSSIIVSEYYDPAEDPHKTRLVNTYSGADILMRPHFGVDIVKKTHSKTDGAPIFSTGDGTVIQSYCSILFGNVIVIDHHDGSGKRLYAHMTHKSPIKINEIVKSGEKIGSIGSTGIFTFEPYLYYEHIASN